MTEDSIFKTIPTNNTNPTGTYRSPTDDTPAYAQIPSWYSPDDVAPTDGYGGWSGNNDESDTKANYEAKWTKNTPNIQIGKPIPKFGSRENEDGADANKDVVEATSAKDITLEEGKHVFYMREKENEKFQKHKKDGVEGDYFYVTTKIPEALALEYWKDYYLYKYKVDETYKVPKEHVEKTFQPLYEEMGTNENAAKIFIPKDKYEKYTLVDSFLLNHSLLAETYKIKERRFARIDKGLVVYSADKEIIEKPKVGDKDAGCYFYVTQVLPQDSVLQDWEDKILNSYYFNKDTVLPYGKDKERDNYFQDKYKGIVQSKDDKEILLTSYYDDTVVGKYLENEPNTAEIFLVEKDLSLLDFYSSYDLKLDTVKALNNIEKPIEDSTADKVTTGGFRRYTKRKRLWARF